MRIKTILNAINCKFLTLNKGEGYWYFVYDDVANNIWEDLSVPVYRLNHMSFERWVQDGKEFVAKCQQK